MRTIAIVQARMGSSRLPGKVLLDLSGAPMLDRVVTRLGRTATLNGVLVATTVEPADQAVVDLCESRGWRWFRGSQDDVLDRYYRAARELNADIVVRVTADCPFIDPAVVDIVANTCLRGDVDYASNISPTRTFPRGLDVEAFSFEALSTAWREDKNPSWREHVTPYLYRNPDRFRIACVANDVDHSGHRWTVDTPEDKEFALRVYRHFGRDDFGWQEVLAAVTMHPEWEDLNRSVEQKPVL